MQRISLTLRSISTFITPEGTLFGQGSRRRTRTDPTPSPCPEREEAELMLQAFALENQSDDLPWEKIYQRGFEVVDFQSLLESAPVNEPAPALAPADELE